MVTDQEIAREVDTLLRQAQPNAMTSLNDVVQQLEAKLGLSLSHKAGFIRDRINLLLRSTHTQAHVPSASFPQNDQFAPQNYHHFPTGHPQSAQFYSHSTLQQQQQQQQQLSPASPVVVVQGKGVAQGTAGAAIAQAPAVAAIDQGPAAAATATATKGSAPAGTKRRGGQGGLNKVCGVSPELQAIVGEPALPRTEIVKQLWAYIRKHNLQDPSNKRKINCDEALRVVFETDCTDMFKMNKLLAKHIIPMDPSNQAKRSKVEVKSEVESSESVQRPVIISDALAKFFGTEEKEMLQSEALRRVWEYIKVNNLEDPLNSMVILCDAKLQELLGCESISAVGIPEMLTRNHLLNR